MDAWPTEFPRQDHVFLGERHGVYERRTWIVVGFTSAMMAIEIGGGVLLGSIALVADGLHMATHVAALSIAAVAYRFARRHAFNDWFSFGTGKFGELAAFGSAIILCMVALLIGYESVLRLIYPVAIEYREAIPIAVLGLAINVVSALLLHDTDAHHHDGNNDHDGHDNDAHDHDHHEHHDHEDHDHDGQFGHVDRNGDAHERHHPTAREYSAHHSDFNIRAAYIHVLADAVTSLLAILALTIAATFGLPWLDPTAGFIGMIVIILWAYNLMKNAAAVLLDAVPSRAMAELIKRRLTDEGDRIADLHLWRLGPGHLGVLAVIVARNPRQPDYYKAKLAGIKGLSHVNVEVNPVSFGPS